MLKNDGAYRVCVDVNITILLGISKRIKTAETTEPAMAA
jgi:hypothetical protein